MVFGKLELEKCVNTNKKNRCARKCVLENLHLFVAGVSNVNQQIERFTFGKMGLKHVPFNEEENVL